MWTSSLSFSSPQTQAFRTVVAAISLLSEVVTTITCASIHGMHANSLARMNPDLSFMTTLFGLLYPSKSLRTYQYIIWTFEICIMAVGYVLYNIYLHELACLFFIAQHTMCARDCTLDIHMAKRFFDPAEKEPTKCMCICMPVCHDMPVSTYIIIYVQVFAQ